MARRPRIPPQLTNGPFSLEQARAAGLTHSSLKGRAWRRLGTGLYCWVGVRDNPWMMLTSWMATLPRSAVFSGATAAWMHGLDLDPIHPVEVVVSPQSGIRSRTGLVVRRCLVAPHETVIIQRQRATSLLWTLSDMCLRYPAVEALVALDMAIHSRLTDATELCRYAEAARGRAGAGRLRVLARLAAPAESPMETRLRWLLQQSNLPRPEVQTNLHDSDGRFVGRADIYFASGRLVVEYDGGNHRDRLVEDDRRQNLLINAGFRLLRFTAADVHQRPDLVLTQVRTALAIPPLVGNVRNPAPGSARLAPNGRNQVTHRWRRGRDLNSRWASDP